MNSPSLRMHHVKSRAGVCIADGGQIMKVKLSAIESSGEMTIIEDVVEPQNGPPLHVHERENEAYYVLEGKFEFVCGGEKVRGGPGTFVHAPRGLPHRYKNVGEAPGRILFTFTPAGIERFFGELVKQKDRSREATAAIARKYGITILESPRQTLD